MEGKVMLRECPFCGNDTFSDKRMDCVSLIELTRTDYGFGLVGQPYKEFYVSCHKCGARGGVGCSIFLTEEEAKALAISKWNIRTNNGGG